MAFFQQLRRRKVIRTAIAYLAGAWLVLQVGETVFSFLEEEKSAEGDKPATDDKPAEDKPADEKPAEEKPAASNDKPATA